MYQVTAIYLFAQPVCAFYNLVDYSIFGLYCVRGVHASKGGKIAFFLVAFYTAADRHNQYEQVESRAACKSCKSLLGNEAETTTILSVKCQEWQKIIMST